MTDSFDQAALDMFDTLGQDAVFMPKDDADKTCRVILRTYDNLNLGQYEDVYAHGATIECLRSQTGRDPEPDEMFLIGDVYYTVQSVLPSPDPEGRFIKVVVI